MDCVGIGREVALTPLAGAPPRYERVFLHCQQLIPIHIVLNKSWRGLKMPVKVHAAHVHFMLERPAL